MPYAPKQKGKPVNATVAHPPVISPDDTLLPPVPYLPHACEAIAVFLVSRGITPDRMSGLESLLSFQGAAAILKASGL